MVVGPSGFRGVYKAVLMPNGDAIQLSDISNTGKIVGADLQGTVARAFFYQGGVFKFIAVPNASFTSANGINASDVIVGQATVPTSGGNSNVNYTATCQ